MEEKEVRALRVFFPSDPGKLPQFPQDLSISVMKVTTTYISGKISAPVHV